MLLQDHHLPDILGQAEMHDVAELPARHPARLGYTPQIPMFLDHRHQLCGPHMTDVLTERNLPLTIDVVEMGWLGCVTQRCLWPVRLVRLLQAEHRLTLALQFAGPSERRDFDAVGIRHPYS